MIAHARKSDTLERENGKRRLAVFVVFDKPARKPSAVVAAPKWREATVLDKPWTVSFQPGRGAPALAKFDRLTPLNENADAGIKYFSGIATYATVFQASLRPGQKAMLDLGRLGDVAEVTVNRVPVGASWHAPYTVDVSKALRSDRNKLQIRVANLWVNRLIGDAQPGANKITFTTVPTYKASAPLRPSGLIWPVKLLVSP